VLTLISSTSIFPELTPDAIVPTCLITNPLIAVGAADVPVAFVALAVGSAEPGIGLTNKLAVLVAISYFTTIK